MLDVAFALLDELAGRGRGPAEPSVLSSSTVERGESPGQRGDLPTAMSERGER
jgi:hypothetical protein